jgi:hypothetical protein
MHQKSLMNFILIIISLFVHIIFLYKRERLFDKKIFIVVLTASVIFFCVSFILTSQGIGNPKFIPALKFPFFASIIFFLMKITFYRIYGKNAEDTFWSMNVSLMKDGVFNFLFWFLGIMIPAFLIYFVGI